MMGIGIEMQIGMEMEMQMGMGASYALTTMSSASASASAYNHQPGSLATLSEEAHYVMYIKMCLPLHEGEKGGVVIINITHTPGYALKAPRSCFNFTKHTGEAGWQSQRQRQSEGSAWPALTSVRNVWP